MSENEGVESDADTSTPDVDAESETEPVDDEPAESTEAESTVTEPPSDLVERVANGSDEEIAREIAALRDTLSSVEQRLENERERSDDLEARAKELESKLKRKQADFQNFKKRQQKKLEDQQRRATEDLVERLLEVRDNLVRALDQEEGADIRGGVETTLRQFDTVLDAEDVEPIEPDPGTEVDPVRHEVLMRVESDEAPGTVADIHRAGYEMAGKVLRPAQVTVAEE
jgi:molecular chaperone GrpE